MTNKEAEKKLRYMLTRCDADGYCKYYTKQDCCGTCCEAVRIAVNALEQADGQKSAMGEIVSAGEGLKMICNPEGEWDVYDDSFDIVIHCKDEEEQKEAREALKASQTWIPVKERAPDDDRYIMLSFANFSLPAVGRYEDGAFYDGDCEEPCSKYGFCVNAWMELPKPYRERKEQSYAEGERT